MKKPSVLVIYSSLPPVGGHSTITLKIIEAFRQDYDEIHVITRDLPGHGLCEVTIANLRSMGVIVTRIDNNGRVAAGTLMQLLLNLRRKGVASLLCVGMRGISPLIAKITKPQRSTYYHIIHRNLDSDFERLAKFSSVFDTIAVISPLSLESLKKYSVTAEVKWIPQISELAIPPKALSANTTSASTPTRFGFLGRLSEAKGVALLLDIWRNSQPEADLYLMGNGELEPQVIELMKATADRPNGRVIYSGAFAASERDSALAQFFGNIDRLCVPSTVEGEGLPTVIIEALQYGVPVLTTPIGGTACFQLDWLRPENPGVIVLEQPDEFPGIIQNLSKGGNVDATLRQACRDYYNKWFTTEIVKNSWKSVL